MVREDSCTLVVDFRYETAAHGRCSSRLSDRPFNISIVENTYDETVLAVLAALLPARESELKRHR